MKKVMEVNHKVNSVWDNIGYICDQILENIPFEWKEIFWENLNKKF